MATSNCPCSVPGIWVRTRSPTAGHQKALRQLNSVNTQAPSPCGGRPQEKRQPLGAVPTQDPRCHCMFLTALQAGSVLKACETDADVARPGGSGQFHDFALEHVAKLMSWGLDFRPGQGQAHPPSAGPWASRRSRFPRQAGAALPGEHHSTGARTGGAVLHPSIWGLPVATADGVRTLRD